MSDEFLLKNSFEYPEFERLTIECEKCWRKYRSILIILFEIVSPISKDFSNFGE